MAESQAKDKVLHALLVSPEAALDPALATDLQSLSINENIFDAMLQYDYLARPVVLQPNTLQSMPEITDQGKTYLLKLKPGIYFSPDPAFKAQRRELTAQDYVYSIKRLYDPAVKSPWLFLFDGNIAGDEVLHAPNRPFNIDIPVAGLQALDRYTLRLRLNAADRNFSFKLAMPASAAVAREIVEQYAGQFGSHPVGTGPFIVGQWQRSFKLELLANRNYHGRFSSIADGGRGNSSLQTALRGKNLPLLDRIEIKIVEDPQARVLAFLRGEFDYLEQLPPQFADMVLQRGMLKLQWQQQHIHLNLFAPMQTYYMWMNMDDPVIGGYSKDKIALRRAIAMAYNSSEDVQLMEHGLALAAQSPLPPNVPGYDATYRNPVAYDIRLANALLDQFGFAQRDRQGYRLQSDGHVLRLRMHSLADTNGRLRDEVWRKTMNAIGLRIDFIHDKHAGILKAARLGKVQMTEANWIADFPDGQNFYQLLYGSNRNGVNYARFDLPAYNQLFERASQSGDGTERQRIFAQMTQLIHWYTPWVLRTHPLSADIWHERLKNYVRHPVMFTNWRYLDMDD